MNSSIRSSEFIVVGGWMAKKEATQRGKTASPLFPVAVLTTATKNREQEVMLSSPVSLAPPEQLQSKCQECAALVPVTMRRVSAGLLTWLAVASLQGDGHYV